VVDSGSSWLTIKACMTEGNCHKEEKEVLDRNEKPVTNPITGKVVKKH